MNTFVQFVYYIINVHKTNLITNMQPSYSKLFKLLCKTSISMSYYLNTIGLYPMNFHFLMSYIYINI